MTDHPSSPGSTRATGSSGSDAGAAAAGEAGVRALTAISSMATRPLLASRADAIARDGGASIAIESVGGVDAAKRVRAGEPFDIVLLAADAIDALAADGHVRPGSRVDWVRSGVAVAVRAGAVRPAIASEAALRHAVEAAASIGYSTGPSGKALQALFARWGLAEAVAAKTVQAPPGVPVGRLIAQGRVELGFQQASELLDLPGIEVLGPLPEAVQVVTTFAGAICTLSRSPEAAAAWLRRLADPAAADDVRRHGMAPA